ncbi:MAG: peptidoglycan-binding protein [Pseudorhodobacter sp.]
MADLEIGVQSKEVQQLQKDINKLYGKKVVPEDGSYDEKTAEMVADLQAKLNVGSSSGKVDRKTMAAIEDAMVPRTLINVKGKKYWVTQEEYYKIMTHASNKAVAVVQPYLSMAAEFETLWKAHESVRKSNKITAAVVDLATGAKFPDAAMVAQVKAAAKNIESLARSLSLDPGTLDREAAKIRKGFAAMDQYRGETFVGGDQLVKNLTVIRDGAVVTLKILVAIKTGGMSLKVQVAAAAGAGAYEGILKEIDSASTKTNVDLGTSALNVLESAVVDGVVALILKGGAKGLEQVPKKAAEAAAKEAAKGAGAAAIGALKSYGIKAIGSGVENVLEKALKKVPSLWRADKELKEGELVTELKEAFITGLAMGVLGKYLGDMSKDATKLIDAKALAKLMGERDLSDDIVEAVKEGIKITGEAHAAAEIERLTPAKSVDTSKISTNVQKRMAKDPVIRKKVEAAKKKKKK